MTNLTVAGTTGTPNAPRSPSTAKNIVFVLETVDAPAFGADLDAATASLTALLRTRARAVEVHVLTAARPACALPAR